MFYYYWYNELKPKYEDKIKLCYTDTDSFIFEVETEDFYADMGKGDTDDSWYDTSGYHKNSPNYDYMSKHNKKVLGKFSDELDGFVISPSSDCEVKCTVLS